MASERLGSKAVLTKANRAETPTSSGNGDTHIIRSEIADPNAGMPRILFHRIGVNPIFDK